jgi:hypothetical protein
MLKASPQLRVGGSSKVLSFEKGKLLMKTVGILLIIGILLSYAPVIPMDDCPEENHARNEIQKWIR